MRHPALLTWNLEALRTADFVVSLDDFGSGTTSLAHLRNLPIDEIKLDRSLVGKMHETREDEMITESVVSIARELGLNVVAEGAEEETTVQRLFQLDCGEIQGFYFSRPLPADQFPDWFGKHRSDGVPFRS